MSTGRRRLLAVSCLLALLGAAVAGAWLYWTRGSEAFGVFTRVRAGHALVLLAITATFVGVRFVRWQYLLRRVDVGVVEPVARPLSVSRRAVVRVEDQGVAVLRDHRQVGRAVPLEVAHRE